MNKTIYQCCFCDKSIESNNLDVVSLFATTNWDKEVDKQHEQQFFCHINCFKQQLGKSVPLYLLDLTD